jgi:hypothetical protein
VPDRASDLIVVGSALAAAMFLSGRNPINDEKANHDRLAAQFGNASWYPHLVAANVYHRAFIVYLVRAPPTPRARSQACSADRHRSCGDPVVHHVQ